MPEIHFIVSLLVLAVIGILISGYLMMKHRQAKPLVCPLDHDCSTVTESKWSHLLYLRNETLGLLFYLSLIMGTFVSLMYSPLAATIYFLFFLVCALVIMVSSFLVYVQAKIIKDYCFYCLISTVINLLLFLNSVVLAF
ncbi:MAG: vitamin K epoxide reductase family protein [Nanoarchaeota archaeon]|nr:vitamin K epoxide reductase family protein [Nanoarchaeota archaeon]